LVLNLAISSRVYHIASMSARVLGSIRIIVANAAILTRFLLLDVGIRSLFRFILMLFVSLRLSRLFVWRWLWKKSQPYQYSTTSFTLKESYTSNTFRIDTHRHRLHEIINFLYFKKRSQTNDTSNFWIQSWANHSCTTKNDYVSSGRDLHIYRNPTVLWQRRRSCSSLCDTNIIHCKRVVTLLGPRNFFQTEIFEAKTQWRKGLSPPSS
jgi:hypothetical protein